jgi:hypothetical protein
MAILYAKAAGGDWDAAGTWSSVSSAGTDNSGPPTASTDVIFEAGSGNVTINAATCSCKSLDCTSGAGDYTGTITHNTTRLLSIGLAASTAGPGNVALKFSTGMTYTPATSSASIDFGSNYSATPQLISFQSSGTSRNTGNLRFVGTGSWEYGSDHICMNTASGVTLTFGTLNTNGQTCSWGLFSSNNANTRSLLLGSSNITITSGAGTQWHTGETTGLTLNAGTSTITLGNTSASCLMQVGASTFNNIVVNCNGFIFHWSGNAVATVNNFTVNGGAFKCSGLTIWAGMKVIGALTINGNSNVNRLLVNAINVGATRTITLSGASSSFSGQYLDFQDIAFATELGGPSMPIDVTGMTGAAGDCGGNSNLTFSSPRTCTATGTVSSSTSWTALTWDSGTPPLPQDNAIINITLNNTLLMNVPRPGRDIDFTGMTSGGGTVAFNDLSSGGVYKFYGSIILKSGVTHTFNSSYHWSLEGRGNHVFNPNGITLGTGSWGLSMNAFGGTYTLGNNLTFNGSGSGTFTIAYGHFDANDYNVSIAFFAGSGSGVRAISMGNGTWTVFANNATTMWNLGTVTNLTFLCEGSTLHINRSTTGLATIQWGDTIYNHVILENTLAGGFGNGSITSTTFRSLTLRGPVSLLVPVGTVSGSTYIITEYLRAIGTSSSRITISATNTARYNFTINGTTICDYINVSSCNSNGSGKFFAGVNSQDYGKNVNVFWRGLAPSAVSNSFLPINSFSNIVGWWKADPSTMLGSQRISQPFIDPGNIQLLGDDVANTYVAGRFTAGRSGNITMIRLFLVRSNVSVTTESANVEIWSDSAGNPGAVLTSASTTINYSSIPTTATGGMMIEIPFSGNPSVVSATNYWVVLKANQISATNYAGLRYDVTVTGNAVKYGNATPTWTIKTATGSLSCDIVFDTYGVINNEPITRWKDLSSSGRDLIVRHGVFLSSIGSPSHPAVSLTPLNFGSLQHLTNPLTATTVTIFYAIDTADTQYLLLSEYNDGGTYAGAAQSSSTLSTLDANSGTPKYRINGHALGVGGLSLQRVHLSTQFSQNKTVIVSVQLNMASYPSGFCLLGYITLDYCFTGYVREIVMISGALSDASCRQIEESLAAQHGATLI